MSKRLHRVFAVVLCLCLVLGMAGCAAKNNISFEPPGASLPLVSNVVPIADRDIVDYNTLRSITFDSDAFMAALDDARALLEEAGNEEAVIDAYYDLTRQLTDCLTAYKVSEIKYYLDFTDDSLMEANAAAYTDATDCSDAYSIFLSDMLASDYRQTYIDEVGRSNALMYENYQGMSDEQKALSDEEKALEDLYTQMAGEDYGPDYADLARAMAPLYLQLIDVRARIADSYGYDNYLDYAYENIYYRSYSPADATALEEKVKNDGLARLYLSYMLSQTQEDYEAAYRYTDASEENLIALMRQYMPRMDERLGEALEYMLACGAYDIAYSDSKYGASFTTILNTGALPFLFSQPDPDSQFYSLDSIVHEFGHYYSYLNDPTYATPDGYVYSLDDIDVAEINSTALELMFLRYYPELYGADADVLRTEVLSDILSNVIFGCIFDEFQQRIYTASHLEEEDISDIFYDVFSSYMGDVFIDDYSHNLWALVNHNFDAPLYYISYGVSALAALQLWEAAEDDPDAAMEQYMLLTAYGTDVDFVGLLNACGLRDVFDADYLDDLYERLRSELL